MSENDQPAAVFVVLLLGAAIAAGAGLAWLVRA